MTEAPAPSPELSPQVTLDEGEAASELTGTVDHPPESCSTPCTSTAQCIERCHDSLVLCEKPAHATFGSCLFSLR